MEEKDVRAMAALAGIAFVVLLVVSIVLVLPAPMPNKSALKIVNWFARHRGRVLTSGVLGGLATLVFLWFLGYLHHVLSQLTGVKRALSSIVLASGVTTLALATVSGLPFAALAVTAGRPGVVPSEGIIHLLDDLNGLGTSLIGFALAVFLLALGLELADGALRPQWAAWVAYAGAILNVIGSVAGFYVSRSGKGNPVGVAGLVGLIAFLVTMVAICIDFLRAGEAATAS